MYAITGDTGGAEKNILERLRDFSSLFYSNLDRHHRPLIGVKFDGLVVSCKFNGQECTEADFKPYLHPTLINCFTFQANQTNHMESSNLLVGPQTGLSLILRSEPNANFLYNSLDNTQNIDSIRLAIHAPGTVPFLMNKGINLKSGMSTSVSLMMKTFDRLGAPYTRCQSEETFQVDSRTFLLTSDACREKCITAALRNTCNCTSTLFEDLTESDHSYCLNLSDTFSLNHLQTMVSRSTCESQFIKHVAGLSCDHCIWDCREIDYEREVAFSDWPHENKITDFIDLYVNKSYWHWPLVRPCSNTIKSYYALLLKKANISLDVCPVSGTLNDTRVPISMVSLSNAMRDFRDLFQLAGIDLLNTFRYMVDVPTSYYRVKTVEELNNKWVKESFYRLNIYFRQSTVEQHSQVPSFTFADLWSGVGGILGLWMGISVMSFIEIWTFIFKPIFGLVHKDKNNRNKIQVEEQVETPHCDTPVPQCKSAGPQCNSAGP